MDPELLTLRLEAWRQGSLAIAGIIGEVEASPSLAER